MEIGGKKGLKLFLPTSRIQFECESFKDVNVNFLVSNFVPTHDAKNRPTPENYFTLGKKSGRPNQQSLIMPFHALGKTSRRYMSFLKDEDAIVWNVDKVILTNRTFFGGPADWCSEDKCASYDDLMKVSDEHTRNFHVKLCERITREGGDYTVLSSLASMRGKNACKDWFPAEKVLNHDRHFITHGSIGLKLLIKNKVL